MSKTPKWDRAEMLLQSMPVFDGVLQDAIEEALEEAEEAGFNDAVREIANGEYAHPLVTEALERYAYLQNGGEWHRETTGDLYVQGFKDALKTLGVLK